MSTSTATKSVLIDNKYFADLSVTPLKVEVTEDAQFVIDLNSLAHLLEISIDFVFNTQNVTAHVIGIYSFGGSSKLVTKVKALHHARDTSCTIDIRGALYENAFSNHLGEIFIDKSALNTTSYLNDHTLLLGLGSKTISMPNLCIHNSEVKASHGASIGSVSDEKIYYLQSRGISKNDAINILVSGFFESTFNDIVDQNMANVFRQKLLTF